MTRWDAARSASRRPLRKYRQVGPVGPTIVQLPDRAAFLVNGVEHSHADVAELGHEHPNDCCECGFHMCDCTEDYEPLRGRSLDAPILDERTFFLDLSGPAGKQLTATPEQAKALEVPQTFAGKMQLLGELTAYERMWVALDPGVDDGTVISRWRR